MVVVPKGQVLHGSVLSRRISSLYVPATTAMGNASTWGGYHCHLATHTSIQMAGHSNRTGTSNATQCAARLNV